MARSITIETTSKLHEGLILTRVAGVLGLGFSVLLEAMVVTPFSVTPHALLAPLLLVALIQIGAGLNEWRQDRSLVSVVLVSFGLFSCSQISQLGNVPATTGHTLAQGAFLLFWGVFAALIAAKGRDCGPLFPLLLAAVATTLFLKAFILIFSLPTLWALPLLAGVVSAALAILVSIRHLPALRS